MANKVTFKPSKKGYWELQREVGVAAITPAANSIAVRANAMCQEDGGEYRSKVEPVGQRTRNKVPYGIVHTANAEAMTDNAKSNTLAKALGGA